MERIIIPTTHLDDLIIERNELYEQMNKESTPKAMRSKLKRKIYSLQDQAIALYKMEKELGIEREHRYSTKLQITAV